MRNKTMRQKVQALGWVDDERGMAVLDMAFDYAIPQAWAEDVVRRTGMWPEGVVWLYDRHAPIMGRPFAVTMTGWVVMRVYHITLCESTEGSWYSWGGGWIPFEVFMPGFAERRGGGPETDDEREEDEPC